jgi:hypothetical protein
MDLMIDTDFPVRGGLSPPSAMEYQMTAAPLEKNG